MTHQELREKYFSFIKGKGFEIIPSASLVPENDPSVLFTTAGVQPLVPYLMGEKHPKGNRVADIQKCTRTVDLESIGDTSHLSFFEMIGYWYLGDTGRNSRYAEASQDKQESGFRNLKQAGINTTYEMFFSDKGFGLDVNRAYFTCFEGNEIAPKDEESAKYWMELGIPEERIFYTTDSNWWEAGENGPCGPDSEVFYDLTGGDLNIKSKADFLQADEENKIVEIGNTVFMFFEKKNGEVIGELKQQNVDMGSGFERVLMAVQGKKNVFETDVFQSIYNKLGQGEERILRIISDHLRTSVMMINDGVIPGNADQGYVLRRLIRRIVRFSKDLDISKDVLISLVSEISQIYNGVYLFEDVESNRNIFTNEINKFEETLGKGLKEFEKMTRNGNLSGRDAFILFTTHGFPFEITRELAEEKNISINELEFQLELEKHKELSKTSSIGKFKGGLAGESEIEIRYHTATHLLNAALRKYLGDHIYQKGSNINTERMRFDFSHENKIEDVVLKQVEDQVNKWIEMALPVYRKEMSYDEAKNLGAIGVFENKYGDVVSVYQIGPSTTLETREIISMELCGGPHVKNTNEIGKFQIIKEEASSKGIRRIKAIIV